MQKVDLGELRGWITLGLFALTIYIVHLVASNPKLEDSKLFFSLATLIVGTCFVNVVGFWFGSSKSSDTKSETINALADKVDGKP